MDSFLIFHFNPISLRENEFKDFSILFTYYKNDEDENREIKQVLFRFSLIFKVWLNQYEDQFLVNLITQQILIPILFSFKTNNQKMSSKQQLISFFNLFLSITSFYFLIPLIIILNMSLKLRFIFLIIIDKISTLLIIVSRKHIFLSTSIMIVKISSFQFSKSNFLKNKVFQQQFVSLERKCYHRFSSHLEKTNNQSTLKETKEPQNQSERRGKLSQIFDRKPQISFAEENKNLIREDYSNSPTHIKFNGSQSEDSQSNQLQGFHTSSNGISINSKSELQLKGNPLALKTLSEGKIDLLDTRISVNSLNLSDSALFGSQISGVHQISLGSVDVLPQNAILLEDIDVNNIPEDKIIVLEKQQKTLYAVGRKVQKQSNLNLEEQTGIQSQNIEQSQQTSNHLYIKKRIFEELSLEEYKDKYLWNFEKEFVTFDFKMLLRALISLVPLLIFSGFFIESFMELYKCKRDLSLMEDQHLIPFFNIRKSLQHEILLNDPRFNRISLFPLHLQTK